MPCTSCDTSLLVQSDMNTINGLIDIDCCVTVISWWKKQMYHDVSPTTRPEFLFFVPSSGHQSSLFLPFSSQLQLPFPSSSQRLLRPSPVFSSQLQPLCEFFWPSLHRSPDGPPCHPSLVSLFCVSSALPDRHCQLQWNRADGFEWSGTFGWCLISWYGWSLKHILINSVQVTEDILITNLRNLSNFETL